VLGQRKILGGQARRYMARINQHPEERQAVDDKHFNPPPDQVPLSSSHHLSRR